MKLTDFIKAYARYHRDSTETIFELDNGNFIILRPCTQTYDENYGLYWDHFRGLWLTEREDYIGVFSSIDKLCCVVTEDNVLRINPDIRPNILHIELEV